MKHAIRTLAVAALLAGCGRDQAPDPAAAAPRADPAAPSRVEAWPLPATMAGSALPDLVAAPDGRLLLSWVNSQQGRRHVLRFSSFDPVAGRWQSAPMTIAIGHSMFVNWADTPHITATPDGALWVHWLQKRGDAPYAYDIMLSTSRNGGARWSEPVVPHDDGTATEHGFVSMWPQGPDRLGIAWLDGRRTGEAGEAAPAAGSAADDAGTPPTGQPGTGAGDAAGAGHAHPGSAGGAMTLRTAIFDGALRRSGEQELDDSVCDCCQTDVAVTGRGPLLVYRGRTGDEVRDILATRLDGEAWTAPRPVHADAWTMPACPVNGPAVAADGNDAVVAWYTAPEDVPEVRIAHSADAGDTFAAPVVLDRGEAVQGRVDIALGDGEAWVLWLREDGPGQSLWLSRRSVDLAVEHERLQVATLEGRGRATGFPQLALHAGVAYVTWTDIVDGDAQLRGARVLP
jgi:hypothetical protein